MWEKMPIEGAIHLRSHSIPLNQTFEKHKMILQPLIIKTCADFNKMLLNFTIFLKTLLKVKYDPFS